MAIALQATVAPAGWLRNRSFDLWFILGIAAIALLSGAVVRKDLRSVKRGNECWRRAD
jgi:hypothetical protein